MVIRPIEDRDCRFGSGLKETLSLLGAGDAFNSIYNRSERSLQEMINSMLPLTGKKFFVGELNGKIIATGSFFIEYKLQRVQTAVHIEDIAVAREFQKKGYGLQMIKFIIGKAQLVNPYKIVLNCSEELIPFYEKLGFKKHEYQMRLL